MNPIMEKKIKTEVNWTSAKAQSVKHHFIVGGKINGKRITERLRKSLS